MPDPEGNTTTDDATLPDTSQHAYKEGRKDDVAGDADKLESNDPKDMQARELDDEESDKLGPPLHPKS
ncbi:MAG TPA: hypothetical protein VG186_11395 [Solirubrobacteraceae bacterium]|jgi:hypothetical protein|nr:hypothetical protein [Solirubrobacteraceae bacterium]